jgi:hypothetical protein
MATAVDRHPGSMAHAIRMPHNSRQTADAMFEYKSRAKTCAVRSFHCDVDRSIGAAVPTPLGSVF